MRQLVQDPRTGELEVAELPDPSPGRNQVLVRNAWSLISPGTEAAVSRLAEKSLVGKALERPEQARRVAEKALSEGVGPTMAAVRARLDDVLTPGYSSSGVVEAVGEGVADVVVGSRVGCVGANAACHAELDVVPAPLTFVLPEGLDARWGAFGALGGTAAHGVRLGEVDAGSVVVVVGLGLVGQLAAQLARAAGARVVAVDVAPERVQLARRLGADGGAGADEASVRAAVAALGGEAGADAVLLTAATKDAGPIELAAAVSRDRATVVAIGDVGLTVPRALFYEKELQLRVSRSYGPGRYDPAYEDEGRDYPIGYVRWTERRLIEYFFAEVAAGRVRLDLLVSHEVAIEQGAGAYDLLAEESRMAILLRYASSSECAAPRLRVTLAPGRGAAPGRGEAPGGRREGRLTVGLVGPGLFARSMLLPLLRDQGVELAGVSGGAPARALGVARKWGAGFAAANPSEVIGDECVDVVVIATRHDSHADLAARALEAGKSVFLEKPLAVDAGGLERLRPLLLQSERRIVVDFNRGFAPSTRRLIAHFEQRHEPVHVSCRVNAGLLEPDHWLRDPLRGGGRLVGEGCHFVDLCSSIVGRRLQTVQAVALGTGPTTLPGDNFQLTLTYEDGSVGCIVYLASGSRKLAKERVEVIGAGRAAVIEDFGRVRLHPARQGTRERPSLRHDKGHRAILAAALEFFRAGGSPPIPYERLLETTEATLRARDCLTSGSRNPVGLDAK